MRDTEETRREKYDAAFMGNSSALRSGPSQARSILPSARISKSWDSSRVLADDAAVSAICPATPPSPIHEPPRADPPTCRTDARGGDPPSQEANGHNSPTMETVIRLRCGEVRCSQRKIPCQVP